MLNVGQTHAVLRPFDRPRQGVGQGFTRDAATGLADGHQANVSPLKGAVVLQLAHQGGVHQDDEVHVPGLAHPVPELTFTHAQVLLPVAMKGLGSGPASFVDFQDAVRFPMRPIRDQDLAWFLRISTRPEHQETYWVVDLRDAHRLGEVPQIVSNRRCIGDFTEKALTVSTHLPHYFSEAPS